MPLIFSLKRDAICYQNQFIFHCLYLVNFIGKIYVYFIVFLWGKLFKDKTNPTPSLSVTSIFKQNIESGKQTPPQNFQINKYTAKYPPAIIKCS